MLVEGLRHTSKTLVTENLTAKALGSGDLNVCGTPAMLALMENAAMLSVKRELPEDYTTVGGKIEVKHVKPTKVGREIEATAILTKIEGKKLYFDVDAKESNELIGIGKHVRFIVHKEKFTNF